MCELETLRPPRIPNQFGRRKASEQLLRGPEFFVGGCTSAERSRRPLDRGPRPISAGLHANFSPRLFGDNTACSLVRACSCGAIEYRRCTSLAFAGCDGQSTTGCMGEVRIPSYGRSLRYR